jgi:CMP-N-acetylneuraminic acid synthetase
MKGFVPEHLKLKNRQELPPYYALSASVCILEWDHFVEHRSLLTPETYAYVTTEENGYDINSPLDFAVAQTLMETRLRGNESQ